MGGALTRMSVWRVTTGAGAILVRRKKVEAERAVAVEQPIAERGNISSDGTMILVRGEGWKELKLAAISRVQVTVAARDGRRAGEPEVHLTQHRSVGGLWDADAFARYQYAEGLRRGLQQVPVLTSVNDGAPWIERMAYPSFRTAGYPIGSGTVESGGKNVIHQRMRRPGRGWDRTHGQELAFLLCAYHSSRFASMWANLSRPAA